MENTTSIKIKVEKVDPQIEQKIKELEADTKPVLVPAIKQENNDEDSSSSEDDDKNTIEPVKSSNEILAELFKVFNAAPPKELLDDKNLLENRKHKKKHKHKDGKKKKHKKGKSNAEKQEGATSGSEERTAHEKHKHKKKKKHKNKEEKKDKNSDKTKSKDKASSKDKDKDKECEGRQLVDKQKSSPRAKEQDSSSRKRTHASEEAEKSAAKGRCQERNRDYEPERERSERHNGRARIKSEASDSHNERRRHGHVSDISLSDEEVYLKERARTSDRRRSGNGLTNRLRTHNSFYDGIESIRSPKRGQDRNRYHNSLRRSRSRSRSHDLCIDKKRLLEIARKNAISMFKRGNMPGSTQLTEEIKDKVLLKMRYGGRTVQDLTDFCKKISNGENLSSLSSDEDSDVDKGGNAKAFHHPFLLKEHEPIVMHIRNSKPRVPIKEDQTKAITMQFPVSSGQQHRMTEVWVPVETKDKLTPLPALPAATQSTSIFKKIEPNTVAASVGSKNVFEKPMPVQEEQEPAFRTILLPEATQPLAISDATETPSVELQLQQPLPEVVSVQSTPTPSTQFVADVPVPSTATFSELTVFPQTQDTSLDVSNIISKRLNAMRRLQDNPMDSEAIKMMHNSQREMTSWASSKHLPGQFTGSTGVNVLKAHELNSGPQLWVRRDQLKSTRPVTGGMGMHLLQKMGWKPGEGLGREKTGALQPLLLDVKLDKRGLVSKEDNNNGAYQQPMQNQQSKKQKCSTIAQATNDQQNKHPVCLLNEMSSKRKWLAPLYNLVNEVGPSHNKMFLFSVDLNGQTFTPPKASNTKKEAKLLAARYCLQQIGVLPPC